MLKKLLLAASLISIVNLFDRPVFNFDEFIEENRISMYQKGVGLPEDFHTPEWDKANPEFTKKQKEVIKNICLNRIYDPNSKDANYVSPEWADSLLEAYIWPKLPPMRKEVLEFVDFN